MLLKRIGPDLENAIHDKGTDKGAPIVGQGPADDPRHGAPRKGEVVEMSDVLAADMLNSDPAGWEKVGAAKQDVKVEFKPKLKSNEGEV